MFSSSVLVLAALTVIFANPLTHDANRLMKAIPTRNQRRSETPSSGLDSYFRSDDPSILTNSMVESEPGASSEIGCLSDDGTNDFKNNSPQRGDIFVRQAHAVCRSNDKPKKRKASRPQTPSSSEQEIPKGNVEEKENPCRLYMQLGPDYVFPEYVTCGGPTVGELTTLPEFVLNCVPDATNSIAERGFFSTADNVIEYCCVSHHNEPPYYLGNVCLEVSIRPYAALLHWPRSKFDVLKSLVDRSASIEEIRLRFPEL